MEISEKKLNELTKRMYLSRMRVLMRYPFYGLLLMRVTYGLDASCSTAYTDGTRIMFGPTFLDSLEDREVDFIMMHEILHIVLRHCFRGQGLENKRYNIACDTVINSTIKHTMELPDEEVFLRCDPDPYQYTPDGKDGYNYTAEEIYEMLPPIIEEENSDNAGFDDHNSWIRGSDDDDSYGEDIWINAIKDACEAVNNRICKAAGNVPGCIERKLLELGESKHDWRTILNNFIQEEINDYSFTPPDRRYDGDFFLPDFNDTEEVVKDILFMIDTSGSMSEKDIANMYSEIKGAVDQFGGKLVGKIGFFDAKVVPPREFTSVEDFKVIKPIGGGGTSFDAVFHYVKTKMEENMPSSMIMLTDGYAPFPDESALPDIPLLWVINNKEVTPPYGKVVRI